MNFKNYCRVLARIEKHPEQWNQRVWCGTPCCLAGHAKVMFRRVGFPLDAGAKVLELNFIEACWLFEGDRTLEDFQRVRHMEATRRLFEHAAA